MKVHQDFSFFIVNCVVSTVHLEGGMQMLLKPLPDNNSIMMYYQDRSFNIILLSNGHVLTTK